jgi:hypothetical protein
MRRELGIQSGLGQFLGCIAAMVSCRRFQLLLKSVKYFKNDLSVGVGHIHIKVLSSCDVVGDIYLTAFGQKVTDEY